MVPKHLWPGEAAGASSFLGGPARPPRAVNWTRGILTIALVSVASAQAGVRLQLVPEGPQSPCHFAPALTKDLAEAPVEMVTGGAELEATLAPRGADWVLRLARVGGVVALERHLSGARGCDDVALAAALIIDRYARQLPGASGRDAGRGLTTDERGGAERRDARSGRAEEPSVSSGSAEPGRRVDGGRSAGAASSVTDGGARGGGLSVAEGLGVTRGAGNSGDGGTAAAARGRDGGAGVGGSGSAGAVAADGVSRGAGVSGNAAGPFAGHAGSNMADSGGGTGGTPQGWRRLDGLWSRRGRQPRVCLRR